MGVGEQVYVNPVLSEEMIQFLLPAADTVDIPAGQPQGFSPRRPSRPCPLYWPIATKLIPIVAHAQIGISKGSMELSASYSGECALFFK